jgi:hypothetical protein
MDKIELGSPIEVSAYLKRRSEYRQDNKIRDYKQTEFKRWDECAFRTPKKVIVIGIRTLSNGYNLWDEDMGNVYYPQTYFKALLVVENLRSKPFYIAPPIKQEDIR